MLFHRLLAAPPSQYAIVRAARAAGIASAAVLLAAPARAEPGVAAFAVLAASRTVVERSTPAELEAAYLECDRMAKTTLLDFGAAAHCSTVYETFKERVFHGDFKRLLSWHQQLREAPRGHSESRPD